MRDFVRDHLGPQLRRDGLQEVVILGYDQNRGEELERWARILFSDAAAAYFGGTAVHWYASTYDYFPLRCSTPIGNLPANTSSYRSLRGWKYLSGKMITGGWSKGGHRLGLGLGAARAEYLHPEICAGIPLRERHHRLA